MRAVNFLLLSLFITLAFNQVSMAEGFSLKEIANFQPDVDFGAQDSQRNNITHITQPVLTPDKTGVLVVVSSGGRTKLYLFNSNGKVRWTYPSAKDQFLQEWFRGPVMTSSGTIAISTTFGKILYIDSRTGTLSKTVQISDSEGTVDNQDKRGPFEYPSLAQDKQTLIVPSNSGKIQFLKDGQVTNSIKIDCKKEAGAKRDCYFWEPIAVRNDGVLAANESSRIVFFKADGTILNSVDAGNAKLTLSEDGNTFVAAYHVYEKPTLKSRILVSGVSNGDQVYTLDDQLDVSHAVLGQNGSVVFAAQQHAKGYSDKNKDMIGVIQGNNKPVLTYMPEPKNYSHALSTIYSYPTVDASGKIYAAGLDGRLFGLDANGVLQDVVQLQGEPREMPLITSDGTIVVASGGTIYFGNTYIGFFRSEPNARASYNETVKPKAKYVEVILDKNISAELWRLFSDASLPSDDKSIEQRGIDGAIVCQGRNLEYIGLFLSCSLDDKVWSKDTANASNAVLMTGPIAQSLFDKISKASPNNVANIGGIPTVVIPGSERNLFSCQNRNSTYQCRYDKFGN